MARERFRDAWDADESLACRKCGGEGAAFSGFAYGRDTVERIYDRTKVCPGCNGSGWESDRVKQEAK